MPRRIRSPRDIAVDGGWATRWGWISIGAKRMTAPRAQLAAGAATFVTQPEGSSTRLRFDGEKTLAASGSPETAA